MNKKLWEASDSVKNKSNLFKYENFLSENYNYKISKKYSFERFVSDISLLSVLRETLIPCS